jgi:hypothetical protein
VVVIISGEKASPAHSKPILYILTPDRQFFTTTRVTSCTRFYTALFTIAIESNTDLVIVRCSREWWISTSWLVQRRYLSSLTIALRVGLARYPQIFSVPVMVRAINQGQRRGSRGRAKKKVLFVGLFFHRFSCVELFLPLISIIYLFTRCTWCVSL